LGESVSEWVSEAVELVRASGLPNETNAMFTNVEGEWDDVMALIKACVIKVADHSPRVELVMKVDYRPGVTDALHSKVEAVEERLRGR
ncbi:MAG: MTH1187 family thiamine-binding protein, partial [Nitrososphaerales archaeon]